MYSISYTTADERRAGIYTLSLKECRDACLAEEYSFRQERLFAFYDFIKTVKGREMEDYNSFLASSYQSIKRIKTNKASNQQISGL